jgi:hypothetical protein
VTDLPFVNDGFGTSRDEKQHDNLRQLEEKGLILCFRQCANVKDFLALHRADIGIGQRFDSDSLIFVRDKLRLLCFAGCIKIKNRARITAGETRFFSGFHRICIGDILGLRSVLLIL